MDTSLFQIQSPRWLIVPYVANILILIPVCYSLIFSGTTAGVFEGRVANSDGLRILVASLYLAIVAASIGGLFLPEFFAPIILIQIFYKSMWLLLFIVPSLNNGVLVPAGISTTFALIVVCYPLFFWLASR
ncbi:MAG: hypothetical protein AAGA76_07295 [Pseudomonadota bacterium]